MLGVDVGKAQLHGTWRDPATRAIGWQGVVPNNAGGIRQLLRRVPSGGLVVEPTGRYGEALIRAAQAAGREVLLAPARKARAFLWAEQPRAKTDRVDSAGLALYGLSGRLRPYLLPSATVDQVRQLLVARRGVSQSLTSLRQQQAALPRAAAALEPSIAALAQQVTALDDQIEQLVQAAPELTPAAALQAVPGIGPVTAAALAACLVDKQFTHPDQFVAYVGLDIRVRQSGRRRGQQTLSKHGAAELRRLLYLAALAATHTKHDQTFARRYARELAKGLSKTAALNAVARKLAKLAWSLVAHGTAYDPARVDLQPATPRPTSPPGRSAAAVVGPVGLGGQRPATPPPDTAALSTSPQASPPPRSPRTLDTRS
jgi:transposase